MSLSSTRRCHDVSCHRRITFRWLIWNAIPDRAAYLALKGYELDVLEARTDEEARQQLAEASRYASARLSEIEARARYLHDLRGEGCFTICWLIWNAS
jgi:hypothetical protein